MNVKLFNGFYFMYILLAAAAFVGLFFLLRKRTEKTQRIVIGGLFLFNLALHFLKLTFPPYSIDPNKAMSQIWFVNICAVSVLTFPFFFLGKNKFLKDFMFYLGVISGVLALLYPTEAIDKPFYALDTIRFYLTHAIIIIGPLLMIVLKLHTVSYKRIWAMPLVMLAYLLFIMVQNIIQSELGIINLRSQDFFKPNYPNPSLVWGPTDGVAVVFSIFTPKFMQTVPWGPHKGETKFWPFFWLVPGAVIYFLVIPSIIVLIINSSRNELFADVKNLFAKIVNHKNKKIEEKP